MRGDELLLASDANQNLGCGAAASGRWVAVGACGARAGSVERAGAVRVVQLDVTSDANGAADVALAALHAPDPAQGMRFGVSLALSSTHLIVGADGYDNLASTGAVYVFSLPLIAVGATSALVPGFVRQLVHGDQHSGIREHFGCALALSSTRVFVGARGPDIPPAGAPTLAAAGAVHVFGLADGAHLAKLTPVDTQGRGLLGCFSFGAALAASAEGILIVGAPRARTPCAAAARAGTAFLFREREGGVESSTAHGAPGGASGIGANGTSSTSHAVYAQTAQLLPPDAARDSDFGAAIVTFVRPRDGSTLSLIGAPGSGGSGAVYAVGPLASRVDAASGVADADNATGRLLERWWAGGGPKLMSPSDLGAASGFGSALAVDQSSAEALIAAPGAFTGHGAASGAAVRSQMLEKRFGPLLGEVMGIATASPEVAGATKAAPLEVLTPLLIGTDAHPGDAFGTAVAIAGADIAVCGAPYHAHTAALIAGGGAYTFPPPLPSSPPPSPEPAVPPSQPPPALPRSDAVTLAAGVSAGVLSAVVLLSFVAYLVLKRARPLRATTIKPYERGAAPNRSRTPAAALGTTAVVKVNGAATASATTISGAAAEQGAGGGGHRCNTTANPYQGTSAVQRGGSLAPGHPPDMTARPILPEWWLMCM